MTLALTIIGLIGLVVFIVFAILWIVAMPNVKARYILPMVIGALVWAIATTVLGLIAIL